MSAAETHTVDTIYGEAEIEVVECSSCETEIAKAEAEPFKIGKGDDERTGWACEHCASEGPADYPIAEKGERLIITAGAWPILFTCGVIDFAGAFSSPVPEHIRWYVTGAFGALVWVAFVAALYLLTAPSGAPEGVPPL